MPRDGRTLKRSRAAVANREGQKRYREKHGELAAEFSRVRAAQSRLRRRAEVLKRAMREQANASTDQGKTIG